MAALNELVWRTQSTDVWVTFKVFGLSGLTFLFDLSQLPFVGRETRIAQAAAEPRPGLAPPVKPPAALNRGCSSARSERPPVGGVVSPAQAPREHQGYRD